MIEHVVRMSTGWRGSVWGVLIVAVLFGTTIACERGISIRVTNKSSDVVVLHIPGAVPERTVIARGDDGTIAYGGSGLSFTLARLDGSELYSGRMTTEELRDRGYHLVVTDAGIEARPATTSPTAQAP